MSHTGMFRVKYIWFCILCVLLLLSFSGEVHAKGYYEPVEAVIPVFCISISEAGFNEIVIEAEDDISPMPEQSKIAVKNGATGEFRIEISEPGTYKYVVYELDSQGEKINDEHNIYYVSIIVLQSEEGELQCTVAAENSEQEGKPELLDFYYRESEISPEPEEPTVTPTQIPTQTPPADDPTPIPITEEPTSVPFANNPTSVPWADTSYPEQAENVKTGDQNNIAIWVILLLLSAGVAVPFAAVKRKGKETDR
ncbi:MAG: FctA domain-containing protein [Eubacteriales bacterium]|nr:FctA domain-containing protein [Eubacteriales bacterium]